MKRIKWKISIKNCFFWAIKKMRILKLISSFLVVLQFVVQAFEQFVHLWDLSVSFLPDLLQSLDVWPILRLYLFDAFHGFDPAQRARLRRNKNLVVAAGLAREWNLRSAVDPRLELRDSAIYAVSALLMKLILALYLLRDDGLLGKSLIDYLRLDAIFEVLYPRIEIGGRRLWFYQLIRLDIALVA